MTADFSSPYSNAGVAIWGSAIATSASKPYEPAQWRRIRGEWEKRNVVVHECRVTDPRTGWSHWGDNIGTLSSTLDQRHHRHLLLPPLTTQATLGGAITGGCLFHCHFGLEKTLVMGGGTTANFALFKETSESNPVPVGVTYDPGSEVITSLSPILIGGGNTEHLAIGLNGNTAATVLSNLTPTVVGSMHANTGNLWWMIISPVNASTPGTPMLIFQANSTVYALASSAAVGAAPTAIMTNMLGGGYALGVDRLQKAGDTRIFVLVPFVAQSTSILTLGYPGEIISINLEGTAPEPVPLGLTQVYFACLWNRMVVATDGVRVVAYDGETVRDLHFLEGREQNSNFRWGCSGFAVNGGDLFAMVVRTDMTVAANTLGVSVLSVERCVPEMDKWVNVSSALSAATSLAGSAAGASAREMPYGRVDYLHNVGSTMPISKQTGFLHLNMQNSTKWDRMFIAPEGVNPFNHYNQTGASQEIAQAWGASGVWTSDISAVPGFSQYPSVVYEHDGTQMALDEGGSACKIKFEFAVQTGNTLTFTGAKEREYLPSEAISGRIRHWYDNVSAFNRLQHRITITQDSVTFKTPNALPYSFRVMTFLDGNVREPGGVLAGG